MTLLTELMQARDEYRLALRMMAREDDRLRAEQRRLEQAISHLDALLESEFADLISTTKEATTDAEP